MNFIEFCKEKGIEVGDQKAFIFWYTNSRPSGRKLSVEVTAELKNGTKEGFQALWNEFLMWQKKVHLILQERADTLGKGA